MENQVKIYIILIRFINKFYIHLKNGRLIEKGRERILVNINRFKYNYAKKNRNNCIKSMRSKMIDGKMVYNFNNNFSCLRLYEDSRLTEHIICDRFEESERQFVTKFLRAGDIFVDIGANIGLYTVIAGYSVGPTGEIFSFEPCANTYSRLIENIKINDLKNVNSYQLAVSDKNGVQILNTATDYWDAWNSLAKPIGVGNYKFKKELVNTICFDDFALEHNLIGKIKMIKIDVEGWEFKVLTGAFKSLTHDKNPILLIEFNKEALISGGYSCLELEKYLTDIGYHLYIYQKKSKRLLPYISDGVYNLNLIAFKHDKDISCRIGIKK